MRDTYESPLSSRYADKEMKYLFSPDMKFKTWRRLWIALAESEMELGLPVTQEQVDELKAHAEDITMKSPEGARAPCAPRRDEPMCMPTASSAEGAGTSTSAPTSCYVGDQHRHHHHDGSHEDC